MGIIGVRHQRNLLTCPLQAHESKSTCDVTIEFSAQALLENFLELLLDVNHVRSLANEIEAWVLSEENVERRHLLGKLVTSVGGNIRAETRDSDPLWFHGECATMRHHFVSQLPLPIDAGTEFVNERVCGERNVAGKTLCASCGNSYQKTWSRQRHYRETPCCRSAISGLFEEGAS